MGGGGEAPEYSKKCGGTISPPRGVKARSQILQIQAIEYNYYNFRAKKTKYDL